MRSRHPLQNSHFDILIIGGKYLGLSAAGMLAKSGLKVGVVTQHHYEAMEQANVSLRAEAVTITSKQNKGGRQLARGGGDEARQTKDPYRLLAISIGSCGILRENGLVSNFEAFGQPIKGIRVADYNSQAVLDFDPRGANFEAFGYMIDEEILLEKLYDSVRAYPNVFFFTRAGLQALTDNQYYVSCELQGGKILTASFIIAADGKSSRVREILKLKTHRISYAQTAIVCDVLHKGDHLGVAVEKFMPSGPFAILPKPGVYSSSIVWTESTESASVIKGMPLKIVDALIQERFAGYLERVSLASKLIFFPLERQYAEDYYDSRIALVGDALHAIHPLAGQGLNLGLRDAKLLCQLIKENCCLGLDITAGNMLLRYYQGRKNDVDIMLSMTHELNYLFSTYFLPVQILRRIGLQAVNGLPALKKQFMLYAAGLSGI